MQLILKTDRGREGGYFVELKNEEGYEKLNISENRVTKEITVLETSGHCR